MVFLLARDAILCRIVDFTLVKQRENSKNAQSDSKLTASPTSKEEKVDKKEEAAVNSTINDAEVSVQKFIYTTLSAALQTLSPSLVHDALWMYLFLRVRYILESSKAEKSVENDTLGSVDLESYLLHEEAFSDWALENANPGRLSELLRLQREAAEASIAKANHTRNSDLPERDIAVDKAKEEEVEEGGVGNANAASLRSPSERAHFSALERALSAVERQSYLAMSGRPNGDYPSIPSRNPSIAFLFDPDALLPLINDLESLWVFKYLCRAFKLRAWWQTCSLTGRDLDLASFPTSSTDPSGAFLRECGALPRDHFFHDFDLLLPHELLREASIAWRRVLPLCTVAFAARRRARRRARAPFSASSSVSSAPLSISSSSASFPGFFSLPIAPPLVVLTNPAVSSAAENPSRGEKNARVERIERAALARHYDDLTKIAPRIRQPGAAGEAAFSPSAASFSGLAAPLEDLPPHRRMKSLAEAVVARESRAFFLRNALVGLDFQLLTAAGGLVGFYLAALAGASTAAALIAAFFGLAGMLLVEAALWMLREGRPREMQTTTRKARARAPAHATTAEASIERKKRQ